MPTYICQGRYSREAIQGMIKSPEDRTEAVTIERPFSVSIPWTRARRVFRSPMFVSK